VSDTESLEGLQKAKTGLEEDSRRLKEKRRSLEERSKTLEEKARVEKLAIDKKLAIQILEEENRTHDDTVRELEKSLEEENRTHDDAVRELEDKIANLEQQLKPPTSAESTSTQTIPEPAQEIPEDVDEGAGVGMLQEPEQSEVEAPQERPKKKKRGLF